MENKVENTKEEINVIPLLHITNGYNMEIKSKEGKILANKPIICQCRPNEKDSKYSADEYKEYSLKTDENGCLTLDLNDYYISHLKLIFVGDEEYEGFTYEYLIYNEDLKKKEEEALIKLEKENKKIEWKKRNAEFVKNEPDNIAIELNNIGINFKITDDKIDNLKEYVVRSIKRNKGEHKTFHALQDISFKIYKGEKVGVIGYNGAGKSTLLKIISGVYEADKGSMKINGNIAPLLALGAGFDKNYTGRENIFLNGSILGYNEEFLKDKYDEIVEFAELGDFIKLPVKNYSAGMKAKLGFSIATVVNPDILIIDEVLGVGDINFRKKSGEKLEELMEAGTTVILVSHSIASIRRICDTVIWIDQGKLRDYGEVNDILDKYIEDARITGKIKRRQRLR